MTTPSDRRVPDLESECPRPIADFAAIEAALHARHDRRLPAGEAVEFAGRVGADAAAIVAVIGVGRRHREVFVFARSAAGKGGVGLDGPLGAVVDVLDGVLAQTIGVERPSLPLDWQGRPFGSSLVFVRGELRDYAAEEAAAELLGDDVIPRAIPPRAND